MNNQSPLVPLGSLLEQKNKGRTRVKIAVSFVLIIHGIGLLALLVQGCHKDDAATQKTEQTTPPSTQPESPQFATANTNVTPDATVATTTQTPTEPPKSATPIDNTPMTGTEYTIAKGDTYASVASHYKVSVKALEDANPGIDPKKLQIGKKIHVPPQPLPTATGNAGTGASGTPGTTTESTNGEKMYTVKSGDMLITIARSQGSTVKAIRAANNLTSDSIKVGQKLKIPAKVVETASSNSPATPASH